MRLRQAVVVAEDLKKVETQLRSVFELGEPYYDPGVTEFGLQNAVFPIGDTYLEIVSPQKPGTTAGRLLEKRGGDGGYMVIFQTSRGIAAEKERMKNLGVRIVWTADHPDAKTIHLHPRDVGAAIVSIDEMNPPQSWRWAGEGWDKRSKTGVVTELVGAEIQSDDPKAMASRWAEVLGADASPKSGVEQIAIDKGHVRFVKANDGRGEGVSGFAFKASNKAKALQNAKVAGLPVKNDTVTIAGVGFHLI